MIDNGKPDQNHDPHEDQHCFILGDRMLCNFVIRNGVKIEPTKSKYLAFPIPFGRRQGAKSEEEIPQTEKAPEKTLNSEM